MIKLETLERMARGEHVVVVFFGDSITEQNDHLHGHINYAGRLHERLIEKHGRNALFVNAGVSGNTAIDLLDRLDRDVLRFQPDLVGIMIGINDCVRGGTVADYARNLAQLVASIRAAGSESLLFTPHPLRLQHSDLAAPYSPFAEILEVIRTTAARLDVPLCDIHQEWEVRVTADKHLSLMDDWLHPNEHGHRLMAEIAIARLGLA